MTPREQNKMGSTAIEKLFYAELPQVGEQGELRALLGARSRTALFAGARVLGLGDSITRGGAGGAPGVINHAATFLAHGCARSGFVLVGNAGFPGMKTRYIVDQIPSQVLPFKPDVVHFMPGVNDCGDTSSGALSLTQVFEQFREGVATLLANDIIPMIGALPPTTDTAVRGKDGLTVKEAHATLRRMHFKHAQKMGLIWVPYDEVLRSSGIVYEGWGSETMLEGAMGMTNDGTHPSANGYHLMGKCFADTAAVYRLGPPTSTMWQNRQNSDDPFNLIASSRGGFYTDTAGIPSSWNSSGSSGFASKVLSFNGANASREWQIVFPEAENGVASYAYSATPNIGSAGPRGVSPGDRLLCSIGFDAINARFGQSKGISIGAWIGLTVSPLRTSGLYEAMIDYTNGQGLIQWEFTAPPEMDRLALYLVMSSVGASRTGLGDTTIKWRHAGLWNLTRMGIDPTL